MMHRMHMQARMHTCTHACSHTCHVCMHSLKGCFLYICLNGDAHAHPQAHPHPPTHTHTHTHTHYTIYACMPKRMFCLYLTCHRPKASTTFGRFTVSMSLSLPQGMCQLLKGVLNWFNLWDTGRHLGVQ